MKKHPEKTDKPDKDCPSFSLRPVDSLINDSNLSFTPLDKDNNYFKLLSPENPDNIDDGEVKGVI